MARKLRLEFPGACYHVINRGNYRAWVFREEKTKAAFEACLFEACARCQWRLHAFVIMGNHYHLAMETPLGNLVAGMQWLQATFANRFDRLREEHGHLFQGRFKALLVEPGGALGQVCHYIHLNPVRALSRRSGWANIVIPAIGSSSTRRSGRRVCDPKQRWPRPAVSRTRAPGGAVMRIF